MDPAAAIMGWLDLIVFAVMLAVSALIGVYFAYCSANTSEADYLVGGRSMTTFPISLSLFSSFVSGIAMLGYPAEVYVNGGQILYNALSYPPTGLILAYQLLPVFREMKDLSLYEYFDRRFNGTVRFIASCLFIISNMVWLPIVLYVPALAFEQVTKIDLHLVALLCSLVCIYYTTVGGIKAVVWTDSVQAVMMVACIVVVAIKGTHHVGGVGTVWERNLNSTHLEPPLLSLDPTVRHTLLSTVLGGVVRHTADLGLSQSIVQRYMALPSMRHCLHATAALIALVTGFNLLACFCGFVAAAFYHDCDPITTGLARAKDQIIPLFVIEVLADVPGITGVFIAGVFSAGLSSMSTGFNSIAAVVLEDWMRSRGGWTPSQRQAGWILKGVVVAAGLVNLGLMFAVEHLGMVTQLNISMSAMALAPMLTLFVAGMTLPWVDTRGALLGAATAATAVGFLVIGSQAAMATGGLVIPTKPVSVAGCAYNFTLAPTDATTPHIPEAFWMFRISYLWHQPLAVSVGLVVAGLAALAGWRNDPRDVDPRLLAPLVRRCFLPAAEPPAPTQQQQQQQLLHELKSRARESEGEGSAS